MPTQSVCLFSVQYQVNISVSIPSLGLLINTALGSLSWYVWIPRGFFHASWSIPMRIVTGNELSPDESVDATIITPTRRFWFDIHFNMMLWCTVSFCSFLWQITTFESNLAAYKALWPPWLSDSISLDPL